MTQSSHNIEFKDLRKAYRDVKAFLEQQTAGQITSLKKDIEEDLEIAGDDTYELIQKFITVYKLDAKGFDIGNHFLSEGELFVPGTIITQLISLPLILTTWLIRILTFGKLNYTKAFVPSDCYRLTRGLTFGDLVTWYILGKFTLRVNVRFVSKSGA